MSLAAHPSVLVGADLFGDLCEAGRQAALQAGAVRKIASGRTIFSQGDPGETCHTLIEGRVKIIQGRPDGGRSVIRFIGPGEMFGTVAALMGRPFPADAVAVVECVEVYWTVGAMRRLMMENPQIALGSAESAGRRLLELQSRIGELTGERVEQRIARALLGLLGQAGRRTAAGIEIDFPISRQELAEMTGSTLHTVSRTLSAWDEARITASSRRHIIVLRPAALRALAEGAS